MNDLLNLKGTFEQKSNSSRPGAPKLPSNSSVKSEDLKDLVDYLKNLIDYWRKNSILDGCLVSIHYNRIISKSARVKCILSKNSYKPNDMIVGAKFNEECTKHIITYFVPLIAIEESIVNINIVISILENEFLGTINDHIFNGKNLLTKINFKKYGISKTKFQQIIVDSIYIEKFEIPHTEFNYEKESIVTIYDTGKNTRDLLSTLGIKVSEGRIFDETTILLDTNDMKILNEVAPYLISMAVEDLAKLTPVKFENIDYEFKKSIPIPQDEPTIGVIDTLFDERVYFNEWVTFTNKIDSEIPIEPEDYKHGTAVSSIIVDGPSLNPKLEDGCGRFKVRHFGVATSKSFNSFTIIRSINEIVKMNPDIHVWNLSLGSNSEIRKNFISVEAAILDKIQYENDVIFVIAGTNKKITDPNRKIGAPADSINSIVVNSVDMDKNTAEYSREGIVLSFFTKPDICYYGGTSKELLSVCEPLGEAKVGGTSFAAPWIARKLSYLIDIIGLSREVAKALLIDSATKWEENSNFTDISYRGYGVVPIHIEDIVKSPNDEIRFVVEGNSEKYDTYNYNFPVPISQDMHPFVAKATLCYFPKCSRNQGVDYTNTELDMYFGRIKDDKIESINKNKQSIEGISTYLKEDKARKLFRKWDNVKHSSERFSPRTRPRKAYINGMWGMSIKTKERLHQGDGDGIKFGVVVTLKEITGKNRIEDFIQLCSLKGWLVSKINIEQRVDIFLKSEEEIEFE